MGDSDSVRGVVFNIQHYSIHDGPGIRTTVFLKGCPLRCPWCQNPESRASAPELFFSPERCTTPARCALACAFGAIRVLDGKATLDRRICRDLIRCGSPCVHACSDGAFELVGKTMTAREVFCEAAEDEMFYSESGGGVTLSGGEPLTQPLFAVSILKQCREAGLHTALDTTGYAEWRVLCTVLPFVNLVLLDLKHMDSAEHLRRTGVPNELILENAKRIHREFSIPMCARMPIIPGWNDSAANIEATAHFIASELSASVPIHLLKFNRLGFGKHDRLGRGSPWINVESQSDARMAQLGQTFESYGLSVRMGG